MGHIRLGRLGPAWWAACGVAVLSWGCAHGGTPVQHVVGRQAEAVLPPLEGTGLEVGTAPEEAPARRRVGDYVAQRFSGAFRERAFTLVEEVVALDGDVLVVDYTVSRGGDERTLRVRFDADTERVVRVSHLQNGQETVAQLADYEALMTLTSFAPDRNDGRLTQGTQTCLVGPRELDCELDEYSVLVDGKQAVLVVKRSPELERDVAGEVRAVDGTVLYRTELVDLREGGRSAVEETGLSALSSEETR